MATYRKRPIEVEAFQISMDTMSRFVMVTDDSGDRYAINVDRILWIHPGTRDVCMSGTSGAWNGLLTLCPEDIQRLLEMVEEAWHGKR